MLKFRTAILFATFASVLNACFVGDIGPSDEIERDLPAVDFDRLETGEAFQVDVQQGTFFQVTARGDRRDLNDLLAEKEGSTLVIRYGHHRNRRHDTNIVITMPQLYGVNFSGASQSRVSGFSHHDRFTVNLSGASVCQLDVTAGSLMSVLSGASFLSLRGGARVLDADVSGASALRAFDFPVAEADVSVSGASEGQVSVSDQLLVTATGASVLIYRGQPVVESKISGASAVYREGTIGN